MIELRWVERKVKCDAGENGDGLAVRYERSLQIRYDISATQGVHFINPEDRMSPWQDVPTAVERAREGAE